MKITFYRSALNDKREVYKSNLLSIIVPDTFPQDQAVSEAIKQFQEHMKVTHWQELAEFYDII